MRRESPVTSKGLGVRLAYPIETFGSAPIKIIDGDRGKAYPKQSEFRPSGYCLFLSATNVTKAGFDFGTGQFIDEQKDAQLRKGKLQREDVVLTTRGTLGNVAHYNTNVPFEHVRINSGMVILRCDQSKILPRYLFAYLRSGLFRGQVERMRSGVAQPQLPIRDMKWIEIPLPTPSEQERLVEILSAYDDLIENNRRRIALLEEAARLLYREWFVHFRFPGHEHVKIIDGLPEGWERKTYSTLFNFHSGFAFKSKTYQSKGKFGIVTIKNVCEAQFIPECLSRLDHAPEKMQEHCALSTGDILLSLTGNVGRSCIVYGENYLLNQRVAKVVGSTGISRSFTYWTFSNETTQKVLENLAYGVAQLNLSTVKLGEREFRRPSPVVLDLFRKIADPMFQQIITLNLEIVQLAQARDLLLPRLMNGEIAV